MTVPKTKLQLDQEKQAAARAALGWVRSGMTLGLGTGSTADYFTDLLGERVRAGALNLKAVASSKASEARASAAGISVMAPQRGLRLDLAVDGADEIAPDLSLIKGRGGALLREKVLAHASRYFLVVSDSTKQVAALGNCGLPVEVVPFAVPWVTDQIEQLGARVSPMEDRTSPGRAAVSDQHNAILDCRFGLIRDPHALASRLEQIPGVVGHGLFLDYARAALVAEGAEVLLLRRNQPAAPAAQFDSLPE
jgi:ribose 5-phosphate isomerase A